MLDPVIDNISYHYEETVLDTLIFLFIGTLKYAFVLLRDKLADLPNQRRSTVAADIMWGLNV